MLLPPEYEGTRRLVIERRKLLKAQGLEESDIATAVASIIEEHERQEGSRFLRVDGTRPYLFSAIQRKLLSISTSDNAFTSHLGMVYSLNASERFARMVIKVLENHCMHFGEKRELRRWAVWQGGVLYLSNYNGDVWRITGAGVTVDEDGRVTDDCDGRGPQDMPVGIGIEPNGNSVVFADDDGGVPVTRPNACNNDQLWTVLDSIKWAENTVGNITPEQQQRGMMLWMLMLAFPDKFPTKPLLLVEGPPGSGKTGAIQLIQATLHGRVKPLIISKHGERDFKVALTRAPIALLDNTDDYIDWMPNTIAAYVTGGEWSDRQLHTNIGEVIIKPRAFVAVASKNPMSFRTEDVADRSILVRMARRESFVAMDELFLEAEAGRRDAFGHYLYLLNRIVAVLNSPNVVPPASQHRMADFEKFAWVASHALNWEPDVIPDLMDSQQRERIAFVSEHDIVVEMVTQWCNKDGNEDRPISLPALFKELQAQAEYDGKVFVKTDMILKQRMRAPHLHARFDIDDNARTTLGDPLYRISHRLSIADVN